MKTLCIPLLFILFNTIFTLCLGATNFNSTTDQHSLLAFKNSITTNPNGVLARNWSGNASVCSWIGVTCGLRHERVTALNISGLGLGGTLAPDLGNLTFLRSFDVSSNNFTGSIPSDFSKLRSLKEINVAFNGFAGEIPRWLGGFSDLESMQLKNNSFSGKISPNLFENKKLLILDLGNNLLDGEIPVEIGNLSSLETLILAGNEFSGAIPSEIFTNISSLVKIDLRDNMLLGFLPKDMCVNSPNLRLLYLSTNEIEGEIPANINRCRMLEDIRFQMNHFHGELPTEIGSLSRLRILLLYSNNLTGGIPEQIGNISSLMYLHIATNFFIGRIPKVLGNLTSLTDLYLYENNFTGEIPQELANLQNLTGLSLNTNSFYGPIPSFIFNTSSLKLIALSFNNFSGTLPPNMGNMLPNLIRLLLSHNSLTGAIPISISNASNLVNFEMNANSFSGLIPNFGNLRFLESVRIWGNNLTGAESPAQELGFLTSLTSCRFLEEFDISNNPLNGILPSSIGNFSSNFAAFMAYESGISGAIPPEIGNLSGLLQITLSRNKLSGSLPATIGKLKQLQRFYAHRNQLQGIIPREICGMSNLAELNLSSNVLVGPIPECLGELQLLKIVYLSSNRLDSGVPSSFWNLRDVFRMDLSSNNLSGGIPSEVGNLKAATTLDLSANRFSGEIPSSIDGCESLGFLSLANNSFSGSIPQSIGNIRGLNTLDLSENNLSGVIPQALEDLQFLAYLNLSNNRLEGEIPNGGGFVNFTAQSFVNNLDLCGEARFEVPPCPEIEGSRKNDGIRLLKYILPPLVLAATLVIVVLLLIRKRVTKRIPPLVENLLGVSWRRISYVELERGTDSFSETNLLGRGSFGSVYKAVLSDGLNVAVKIFNLELEGASKSFDTESEILSALRHRNLVRIIGCCVNSEFRALILEYMPNGSLEERLHSESYGLDLQQSLQIAMDVALALEYLHHGHTFPVVHCDVKPSNVLLDEDMVARVVDFGISKLFDEGEAMVQTQTIATIGYAAPEYGSEGKVSIHGDVYSYGILLLEIFTSKKPTDDMFEGETGLKEWVGEALQENAICEIVAPSLLSRDDQDFSEKELCVSSMFELAMKCLAFAHEERANMVEIVASLNKIKAKFTSQGVSNTAVLSSNT